METKTRRFHSEEFKRDAVEIAKKIRVIKTGNKPGVHETSIRKCIRKFEGVTQTKGKKSHSDLEKENHRLIKEITYLKVINKILKKSTSIFSLEHLGDSR